jgi:two-component system sensor histidine kinase UhpB
VSSQSQAVQERVAPVDDPTSQTSAVGQVARRAESQAKRKLARELHDSVAPILTVMVIDLEAFKKEHAADRQVVERAESLQASTREVLHNLRQVLSELREQPTVEMDFVPRVRALLNRFDATTGIHAEFAASARWPSSLPATSARNLYGILEEALNNVLLHSGATVVAVSLVADHGTIELIVRDDGRGVTFPDGIRRPGMGMVGMRERAILLGGELEVSADRQGGTSVRAMVPNATRETIK